jgi:hypothetical protein
MSSSDPVAAAVRRGGGEAAALLDAARLPRKTPTVLVGRGGGQPSVESTGMTPSVPRDVDCSAPLVVVPPSRVPAVNLTPHQQMLSSGAGALLVSLFMTPLDVVKIR